MEAVPASASTGTEEGERRRNASRGTHRGNGPPSMRPHHQGIRDGRGPRPPFVNGADQRHSHQPRPRLPPPNKPQTFQLGPLDPLPTAGQSAQAVARAQKVADAAKKQFKVPRSQRSVPSEFRAEEDIGTPLGSGTDSPSVAFMARNPTYLAGIQGSTTDRRPGYLRSQNIPNNATQSQPRPGPRNNTARQPSLNPNERSNGDSWRRPPPGNHTPRPRPPVQGLYRGPARPIQRTNVANIIGTRFQEPAVNVREVMEMLARVPNPWPNMTRPFASAYRYTLTHPDPRSHIPQEMLDESRQSAISVSILKSWQASEPSQENKDAVVRILNQVNAVFHDRYGQKYNFVIEPFGSVSWGGETGDTADVDMTLKVCAYVSPRLVVPLLTFACQ